MPSLNQTNLSGVNFTDATIAHAEAAGALIRDITLTGATILDTPISVGGGD